MLTHAKAKALREPGRYGDGGGLYLVVTKGGSKKWVQRIVVPGRRRDLGLGGFPTISLVKARERAAEHQAAVADGKDPLADKRKPTPRVPTFREAATAVVELNAPRWRAKKHATNWIQSLERHAMPRLSDVPVDRITPADVLAVLTPIWGTHQETARRVRQRVRAVMRWAMAHGYREDNPAGEGIDGALPRVAGRGIRAVLPRGKARARTGNTGHG